MSRETGVARPKQPSLREQRDERLQTLLAKLRTPNELLENVSLPPEFAPALATGRTELLRLVQPRALTEDEAKALYHAFAVLIETNMALQEHARELGKLANTFYSQMTGLVSLGRQIENYANFRASNEDEPED